MVCTNLCASLGNRKENILVDSMMGLFDKGALKNEHEHHRQVIRVSELLHCGTMISSHSASAHSTYYSIFADTSMYKYKQVKRPIQHEAKPSVVWCLETPPHAPYYTVHAITRLYKFFLALNIERQSLLLQSH